MRIDSDKDVDGVWIKKIPEGHHMRHNWSVSEMCSNPDRDKETNTYSLSESTRSLAT